MAEQDEQSKEDLYACWLEAHPTIGSLYGPVMNAQTDIEAQDMFEVLVGRRMALNTGMTREAAERQERENIGYYAGYYNSVEVRVRVQRLFGAPHPIFGPV
jgi:hypothetical protein